MNPIEYISFITISALAGLLLGWFLSKSRYVKPIMERDVNIAALTESIRNKTEENQNLKSLLNQAQSEIKTLSGRLLTVSENRSAAESRLENLAGLNTALDAREKEISDLHKRVATLQTTIEKERTAFDEKVSLLQDLRQSLTETYKVLSASALKENNQTFVDLAQATLSKYLESVKTDFEMRDNVVKEIIHPLKEALDRYDTQIQAMERSREKAYGGLSSQVQSLLQTQDVLRKETGKLVNALRVPHVRGRWGEITLKRVAELAGMQNHCDFFEQTSTHSEDGVLRPDMIIHLPENRLIIIDAKVPLTAYLDALETHQNEEKESCLSAHAKHVQTHIHQLSQKAYWTQFNPTPEFVVLFIPGENFFSAALEKNPRLIELGVKKNVILATPTTLISLLKTVSFGWQQEKLTENARKISDLGTDLFERLSTMGRHINGLGHDIERCIQTYNKVVGSLERRVLVSARKFKDLGISQKDTKDHLRVRPIDAKIRNILGCKGDDIA
jgi:DNA recombination protein RmuC